MEKAAQTHLPDRLAQLLFAEMGDLEGVTEGQVRSFVQEAVLRGWTEADAAEPSVTLHYAFQLFNLGFSFELIEGVATDLRVANLVTNFVSALALQTETEETETEETETEAETEETEAAEGRTDGEVS